MLRSTTFILAALLFHNSAEAICQKWSAQKAGTLNRQVIDEASGLVASQMKPGHLIWSNDSGGRPELYATTLNGSLVRTVHLNGFSNTDFEAITRGPCPSNKSMNCLYVGDIGDGIGWRFNFKIGIFQESDFWSSTSINPEKVITYKYPNGGENAEGMIVTKDGRIIIFSKDNNGLSQIYQITGDRVSHIGQINLTNLVEATDPKGPRITDASLSANGNKILFLTYGDILEVNSNLVFNPDSRRSWRQGTDYNLIKGPELPQQETITYLGNNDFMVSTESPDGDIPELVHYTCQSR